MKDQELVDALVGVSMETRNGVCVYNLLNDCPAGWGVTIAVAGVNFYYKDGSSETVGPRPVRLTSGQSASFLSTKGGGCVKKCFLAMTVVVDGEGSQNMTDMTPDAGADRCYLKTGIVLGPKRIVQESELGRNVSGLLALTPL